NTQTEMLWSAMLFTLVSFNRSAQEDNSFDKHISGNLKHHSDETSWGDRVWCDNVRNNRFAPVMYSSRFLESERMSRKRQHPPDPVGEGRVSGRSSCQAIRSALLATPRRPRNPLGLHDDRGCRKEIASALEH